MNKIEPLKKIQYDSKLSAFDLTKTAPCTDRLITYLELDDYDWMSYRFTVFLPTKAQGFLKAVMEYSGMQVCEMSVTQIISEDTMFVHTYHFDADLFKDFIKEYLERHLEQWEGEYAFYGGDLAVQFFNDILDKHRDYTAREAKGGETA